MKTAKIIVTLFLVIAILMSSISVVLANVNPDDYRPKIMLTSEAGGALDIAKKITSIVSIVSGIIFVATILILGIKYMMGSLEERANYKKTMIPVVIGGIMIFGITTILQIIMNMMPEGSIS